MCRGEGVGLVVCGGKGGGGAAIQPGNNPAEVSPWSFSKKHNLQKRKQTFFYILTTNFYVMHRGLCSVHCIIMCPNSPNDFKINIIFSNRDLLARG